MSSMTLIYPQSPEDARALKILCAAALVDLPLVIHDKKDETHPAFLSESDPCAEYPILKVEDNTLYGEEASYLSGPNAILRYVARLDEQDAHHVYGRTPFEASQIDMWVDFSSNYIDRSNAPYIRAVFEEKRGSPAVDSSVQADIERVLVALDEVLSIRTFLVGERMSIADIAVAFSVHWVYRCNRRFGEVFAKKHTAVYRHYNTVMRHPKIREVLMKEKVSIGPLRPM